MNEEKSAKEKSRQLSRVVEQLRQRIAVLESGQKQCRCEIEACQAQNHLLTRLLDVEERKQKLMAYEIHDGLTQQLAGAIQRFEIFRDLQPLEDSESIKVFDVGMNLLRSVMGRVKSASRGRVRIGHI